MPHGVVVSNDVRLIVLRMSSGFPTDAVAYWTGVSKRLVQKILHDYQTKGFIGVQEHRERHSRLTAEVMQARSSSSVDRATYQFGQDLLEYVVRNPDLQLADYRQFLIQTHQLSLDISTISRALRRAGYSRKLVSNGFIPSCLSHIPIRSQKQRRSEVGKNVPISLKKSSNTIRMNSYL